MKKEKQKQKRYRKLHFMGVLQNRRSILIRTYKHYNFYIQWEQKQSVTGTRTIKLEIYGSGWNVFSFCLKLGVGNWLIFLNSPGSWWFVSGDGQKKTRLNHSRGPPTWLLANIRMSFFSFGNLSSLPASLAVSRSRSARFNSRAIIPGISCSRAIQSRAIWDLMSSSKARWL